MVLKMKFVLYSLLCLLNRIPEESLKKRIVTQRRIISFRNIWFHKKSREQTAIFFNILRTYEMVCVLTHMHVRKQIFTNIWGKKHLATYFAYSEKSCFGVFFNRYFRSLILILTLLMCTVKISPSVFARFRT